MISFEGLDSTALKLQLAVAFNHSYNAFLLLVLLNVFFEWGGLYLPVL